MFERAEKQHDTLKRAVKMPDEKTIYTLKDPEKIAAEIRASRRKKYSQE